MIAIILLSLGGAIIAAVVGTLWYSDSTPMGKIHMKSLGFDKLSKEEKKKKMVEAKPMMPKIYGAQMGLSFLTSFAVVFIVTMSIQSGIPLFVALIFVTINWLCFIVPTIGGALLWSNCDKKIVWKKFFSDIFSSLVTLILVALMTSLFI